MTYVAFDEIKWLCAFTKYTTQIYHKATIYVKELILNQFNPFDIKCKILNLMWQTSGNVSFGDLGGWIFHIFQEGALNNKRGVGYWGVLKGIDPQYLLELL